MQDGWGGLGLRETEEGERVDGEEESQDRYNSWRTEGTYKDLGGQWLLPPNVGAFALSVEQSFLQVRKATQWLTCLARWTKCVDQARRSLGVQTGRVEEAEWDQKMGKESGKKKARKEGETFEKEASPRWQPYWAALDGQKGDQTIVCLHLRNKLPSPKFASRNHEGWMSRLG